MAHTIREGDWVLLLLSGGERRLMQARATAKIHIGRSTVLAAPLIGAPFGTNFRLDTSGGDDEGAGSGGGSSSSKKRKQQDRLVLDPRTVEQIDGSVGDALADMRAAAAAADGAEGVEGEDKRNNATLFDDGSAQALDEQAIKRMKQQGAQGEAIVKALAQNSATFAAKTAFSQEKWMKKKAKRHLLYLTAARPTALSVCDMYTLKGPDKLCGLRRDSLGLLLALSNAQPGARVLVLETGCSACRGGDRAARQRRQRGGRDRGAG